MLRESCRSFFSRLTGTGPKVTLSTHIIHFGSVESGVTVTRTLSIENHSGEPVSVQFCTEPKGIFSLEQKHWAALTITKTSAEVRLHFSPCEPLNYYKRIFILVNNAHITWLDVMGTCYKEQRRPPDFFPRHVWLHHLRQQKGLGFLPPEQLEDLPPLAIEEYVEPSADSLYEEYFSKESSVPQVEIEEDWLDFGACSVSRPTENQTVHVVNNTKGKVTCVWIAPGETSGR